MSAKNRALSKLVSFKDLEAKFQNNVANRIEREHYWLLKSVGESVPVDINDLWEYANEQLKHLDPTQTRTGVLIGEHDPMIQELFYARRGIWLSQLALFELWKQPVKVESKIKDIQSQLVEHYLTINRVKKHQGLT